MADTVKVSVCPSFTALLPMAASTGASLTAVMVTLTVAAAETSVPSLTRNPKLSAPLVLGFGV